MLSNDTLRRGDTSARHYKKNDGTRKSATHTYRPRTATKAQSLRRKRAGTILQIKPRTKGRRSWTAMKMVATKSQTRILAKARL